MDTTVTFVGHVIPLDVEMTDPAHGLRQSVGQRQPDGALNIPRSSPAHARADASQSAASDAGTGLRSRVSRTKIDSSGAMRAMKTYAGRGALVGGLAGLVVGALIGTGVIPIPGVGTAAGAALGWALGAKLGAAGLITGVLSGGLGGEVVALLGGKEEKPPLPPPVDKSYRIHFGNPQLKSAFDDVLHGPADPAARKAWEDSWKAGEARRQVASQLRREPENLKQLAETYGLDATLGRQDQSPAADGSLSPEARLCLSLSRDFANLAVESQSPDRKTFENNLALLGLNTDPRIVRKAADIAWAEVQAARASAARAFEQRADFVVKLAEHGRILVDGDDDIPDHLKIEEMLLFLEAAQDQHQELEADSEIPSPPLGELFEHLLADDSLMSAHAESILHSIRPDSSRLEAEDLEL
jgi:hypothetical protein